MGASLMYLNEPKKDIEHENGKNKAMAFAAGSMQGWRLNMVSTLKPSHRMVLKFFGKSRAAIVFEKWLI